MLKRGKLLLPFVWVYRWVTVLLFRRDNIRRNFDKINTLTADNIRGYQAELNYVGLNFNFGEKEEENRRAKATPFRKRKPQA